MDTKQLKDLIKLLKAHGVTEYSYEGLHLVLDLKSQPRAYKSVTGPSVKEDLGKPQYNEEDTLFWSSHSIPEEQQS